MTSSDSQSEMDAKAIDFLTPIYANHESQSQVHVTLTFAQSIDAKIAGKGKKMLPLSGKESMMMTHRLRAMHDGILVGIGTILNDNPQLNARQLPSPPPVSDLPRPIVLDTHLRTPLECKLIKNFKTGIGRKPLIISLKSDDLEPDGKEVSERRERSQALKDVGVEVVEVASFSKSADNNSGHLPWTEIRSSIAYAGIKRVMIEGGATVISSLLSSTTTSTSNSSQEPQKLSSLIDTLIITVSPTMVGKEGVAYQAPDFQELDLIQTETKQFGRDAVFVWEKQGKR